MWETCLSVCYYVRQTQCLIAQRSVRLVGFPNHATRYPKHTLARPCMCLPGSSNATSDKCKGLTPKNIETNEYNTIQYRSVSQASQMRGDPKKGKQEERILVTLGLGIWSNDALASFSKSKYIGRPPL